MYSKFLILVLVVMFVFTGCIIVPFDDGDNGDGGDTGNGYIKMVNNTIYSGTDPSTGYDIYDVILCLYIDGSSDLTGTEESIDKGESFTAEVSAGYHDVEIKVWYSEWDGSNMVYDEDFTFTKSNVYVSSGSTTTLTYTGEGIN
jgi:hypothetical protein